MALGIWRCLSYVLHHVEDRAACAGELARVLRPGGLVLVRTSLRDSLDGIPWLEFFSAARALAERRLPSADELVELFTHASFERVARDSIRQELAPSMREHYERIRVRAISTLELLDDADFEAGIAAMRTAAEHEARRGLCSRTSSSSSSAPARPGIAFNPRRQHQ